MSASQLKFVLFLMSMSLVIVQISGRVYTEDQFIGMNWCYYGDNAAQSIIDSANNTIRKACQLINLGYRGACEEFNVSLVDDNGNTIILERRVGVCRANGYITNCVTEANKSQGVLKWVLQSSDEMSWCFPAGVLRHRLPH